jgi:hypothetical protein
MKLRINNKAMTDNEDFVLIYPGQSLVIEEAELERTECGRAETCDGCTRCHHGDVR